MTCLSLSEQMHVSAKIMLATMQLGLERKRRIARLRADLARLKREVLMVERDLRVEEEEQLDEGKLVHEMWDQWKADAAIVRST